MLHERIEFLAAIKEGQEAREKLREEVRALLCRFLEDEFGFVVTKEYPSETYVTAVNSLVSDIVRSLTGGW